MAKAPRPGTTRRNEEATVSTRILAIKLAWEDDEYRIAVGNIPLDERMAVRKATGIPFEAFLGGPDSIGVDSIAVMVWLAKRQSGLSRLSWQQFQRSWPTEFSEGDLDVWGENAQGQKVDDEGNPIDDDEESGASDPES